VEKTDLVQGVVASQGLKNLYRAKARIVLAPADAAKVKNGEFLVATMTSPDYLPAMNKAAGFITDEGGLTCHAAIVAREMNKPCVIGTKIATKVFRDGDLVEVDAKRGIVRKLFSND
jgi:pyruvate,water dikinase